MSFLALAIASMSACEQRVTIFDCGERGGWNLNVILSFKVPAENVGAGRRERGVQTGEMKEEDALLLHGCHGFSYSAIGCWG